MREKISEKSIRREKVKELKAMLSEQISDRLSSYFEALCITKRAPDDKSVRRTITRMHNLYVLQDFLNLKDAFMCVLDVYEERDVIIYEVSSDTLDWMLQEEHLLSRILSAIENTGAPAEAVLCDRFFHYEVFGVIDKIVWDKKKTGVAGE